MSTVHAGPRLGGAPISWGVCEVPGWGVQLEPDRVLAEMASLGLGATELGPQGWLAPDGRAVRAELDHHELRLVGGFVPLVAHTPEQNATREAARRAAEELAVAGGEVFVAATVQDADWATPVALDGDGFARLGANLHDLAEIVVDMGLRFVLHPHVGTLVQSADDVRLALEHTDVEWCLDTGHLLIGGIDPEGFVREHGARVGHVHLKDVDAGLAAAIRAGELTLLEATRAGLFRPLGAGDVALDAVLLELGEVGYDGWFVLEQDLTLADADADPAVAVAQSLRWLEQARTRLGR